MLERRLEWLKAGPRARRARAARNAAAAVRPDAAAGRRVGSCGAPLRRGQSALPRVKLGFPRGDHDRHGRAGHVRALLPARGALAARTIAGARAGLGARRCGRWRPAWVARSVIAWTLATAVPVGGIGLVAFGVINGDTPANNATAWSIVFLVVRHRRSRDRHHGLRPPARSAEPIRSVRAGLARIEGGARRTSRCPSTTPSEVGLLQAGFQPDGRWAARGASGCANLFGRHVGEDVAREALAGEIKLGGELRDAAVLFVDIVGSTRLAGRDGARAVGRDAQ